MLSANRHPPVALDSLATNTRAVARGTAVLALQDAMLGGEVTPAAVLDALMTALAAEGEQLLTARYLGMAADIFWRFLTPDARTRISPALERLLWQGLNEAADASTKASWFGALRNVALTEASLDKLHAVWAGTGFHPGTAACRARLHGAGPGACPARRGAGA